MAQLKQAQGSLPADRQNYNCIDLAKFICAILVVTGHVPPFGVPDEIGIIAYLNFGVQDYLARIAVPFFMVCSGFFLYNKSTLDSFSIEPTKKYALRLFRLYITWSLIYLPLSYRSLKGMDYAVLVYIRNCIFAGSYSHLWYLNAVIFAVLLVSFLLYKRISPLKMLITALILYIIGLFGQSWFGFITPLRTFAPLLWSLLKIIKKIIVTTRNGLFEGFLFVCLGMLFAFYNCRISKSKALVGFLISMVLLFFESFVLNYLNFARAIDMYLFLIPVTFFGFSFIVQVELPDNPIYKTLRTLSSLIFYSHNWIKRVLISAYAPLLKTCLLFVLTLIITITGSLIVMKLSELPKMKWLKKLYT